MSKKKQDYLSSSSLIALSTALGKGVALGPIRKDYKSVLEEYSQKTGEVIDLSRPLSKGAFDYIIDSLIVNEELADLKAYLVKGLDRINQKSPTGRRLLAQTPAGVEVTVKNFENPFSAGCFSTGERKITFSAEFKRLGPVKCGITFLHEVGHLNDDVQLRPRDVFDKGYVDEKGRAISSRQARKISLINRYRISLLEEAEKKAIGDQIFLETASGLKKAGAAFLFGIEWMLVLSGLSPRFFCKPIFYTSSRLNFQARYYRKVWLLNALKKPSQLFSSKGRNKLTDASQKETIAKVIKDILFSPVRLKTRGWKDYVLKNPLFLGLELTAVLCGYPGVFFEMAMMRFVVSDSLVLMDRMKQLGQKGFSQSQNVKTSEIKDAPKKGAWLNVLLTVAELMLIICGHIGVAIALEMMRFGVIYKNQVVKHKHDIDIIGFRYNYHLQSLYQSALNREHLVASSKIYDQLAVSFSHKCQNILSVEDINNIELLRSRDEAKLSGEQLLAGLDPDTRADFNLICTRVRPFMSKIDSREKVPDMEKNWIRLIAVQYESAAKLTEQDMDKHFTKLMEGGLNNQKAGKFAYYILKSFSLQDIESLHLKEFKKAILKARKTLYVKRVEKQKKFLSLYDERFRC